MIEQQVDSLLSDKNTLDSHNRTAQAMIDQGIVLSTSSKRNLMIMTLIQSFYTTAHAMFALSGITAGAEDHAIELDKIILNRAPQVRDVVL